MSNPPITHAHNANKGRLEQGLGGMKSPNVAIRAAEVARMLGVSIPTVWRWARTRPEFPKPRRLGARTTRWMFEDMLSFMESCPERQRAQDS